MKNTRAILPLLAAGMTSLPLAVAAAPSYTPKPLSSILQAVEAQESGRISEAELDDDVWKVKVCTKQACERLYLDPVSGKELRRKDKGRDDLPPKDGRDIAALVKSVEEDSVGRITEVEFEHGVWKIKSKLRLDPMTGEAMAVHGD